MAFVSSRSRERARRRKALILRVTRWLVMLGVFAGIGYSSYETGLLLADTKVVALREDLLTITRERDNAFVARDNAQAALGRANEQIASLQTRYDTDVPRDDLASMLQVGRERIQAGIAPERIMQAMRAAGPVVVCGGRAVSKRFAIRTSEQGGADDNVSFAEGLINVHVTVNPDDAARPLNAHFARFGNGTVTVSGATPVHHTVIVDNAELRFTISFSDLRGYVIAAMSSCGR